MIADLTGQVAIVTGGGRGIGQAIALRLAQAGAAVALTSRTQAEIDATAAHINESGGRALAVTGDVTSLADVRRVVAETRMQFGRISILVNNAGVSGPFGPIWKVDPEFWWRTQEIHLKGAFLYLHEVLPEMVEARRGRIVNIVSLAGMIMPPYSSAYSQAKAGLIRLTAYTAAETAEHGLLNFAVEPGTIHTRMADEALASPEVRQWAPGLIQLIEQSQRESDPETGLTKCADLCLSLLSGCYDELNGQYLDVREDLEARLRSHRQNAAGNPG